MDKKNIIIDSKSLPRSGLHFLEGCFRNFCSDLTVHFCEWYHEPGCCRSQPCKVAMHFVEGAQPNQAGIFLCKSHDFALGDEVYKTTKTRRRLILVRDPLSILTSWFELHQVARYQRYLRSFGIEKEAIQYRHDAFLYKKAIQKIDEIYSAPDKSEFKSWLKSKAKYIFSFCEKWLPYDQSNDEFTDVLTYPHITEYVEKIVSVVGCEAAGGSQQSRQMVSAREPFALRSKLVSDTVWNYRKEFEAVSGLLLEKTRMSEILGA